MSVRAWAAERKSDQVKALAELEARWFQDGGGQTVSGRVPCGAILRPLDDDEDPRFREDGTCTGFSGV